MKTWLNTIALVVAVWLMPGCDPKPPTDTESPPSSCTQKHPPNAKMPICTAFPTGRCGTCADLTGDTSMLCPFLPRDVDVETGIGYSGVIPICQKPFDWFSWQTFVALNWPADANGKPLPVTMPNSPGTPRVWENYFSLGEVFFNKKASKTGLKSLSQISKADPSHFFGDNADLEAATNLPLLDRNLNFALFEVVVNDVEKDYIQGKGLTTYCGQKNFKEPISFPFGSYPDSIGSIEIKAGWRVLLPGVDDTSRYYKRQAIISVPGNGVVGGKPINDTVWVGLVSMHIARQVKEQNNSWVWSSFEQVDNAPDCPLASCPDSIPAGKYSFYNPSFPLDTLNMPPSQGSDPSFLWSGATKPGNPQYGRRYATNGTYGTQVGRLHAIEPSTQDINAIWQQKLQGTVWANYKLIGSQWRDTEKSQGQNTVGIPVLQANTIAETYLQSNGSCINCHSSATTTYGQNANFSFVLGVPPPDSTKCQ